LGVGGKFLVNSVELSLGNGAGEALECGVGIGLFCVFLGVVGFDAVDVFGKMSSKETSSPLITAEEALLGVVVPPLLLILLLLLLLPLALATAVAFDS
jgi:hypothetical protein